MSAPERSTRKQEHPAGDQAHHWAEVYNERRHSDASWFESHPSESLQLIDRAPIDPAAAVIDVGGGASALAPTLVRRGAQDVTVADISSAALDQARERAGDQAQHITYLQADVLAGLPRIYDLWHDRAVLHFMTTPEARNEYLSTLGRSLAVGGHVVLATFSPLGPASCSGLDVDRYSATDLAALVGPSYHLLEHYTTDHHTPTGATQQFTYALFHRTA